MAGIIPALFEDSLLITTTTYIGVPIHTRQANKVLGFTVGWKDGTSAFTIALEFSNEDDNTAPVDEAGSAWEWIDSGETITGGVGSAAGMANVLLMNVQARRARLVIVTTAASDIVVRDGAA